MRRFVALLLLCMIFTPSVKGAINSSEGGEVNFGFRAMMRMIVHSQSITQEKPVFQKP